VRLAERQQQLAASLLIRPPADGEGVERHAIQASGLLVRDLRRGSVAGAPGVFDRLVGHTDGSGGEVVLRELGQVGLEV
jgi:hypothetical protein